MITLLRGGWLAAWDGTQHRIIERGEVAFQGSQILYAGPHFEGQADEVMDRPEWFICPGFINLHGHVGVDPMAPLVDIPRGGGFAPGPEFVENAPLNMEPTLSLEEQQLSEVIKGLDLQGPILLPPVEDLPFLAQPLSPSERAEGQRLARQWDAELEESLPIQVVGSGPNLNAATQNALERTAALLEMSLDEVQNRATITGAIEIGRAPGLALVSLLAPVAQLDKRGFLHLVREQYER